MAKAVFRPTELLRLTRADRLMGVWLILMMGICGLFSRLVYLQVYQGAMLRDRVKEQQAHQLQPFVPRRTIIDRNQQVLALDRPAYLLYVHPSLLKRPKAEIAQTLAPLINQKAEEITKKSPIKTALN